MHLKCTKKSKEINNLYDFEVKRKNNVLVSKSNKTSTPQIMHGAFCVLFQLMGILCLIFLLVNIMPKMMFSMINSLARVTLIFMYTYLYLLITWGINIQFYLIN